MSGTNEGLGWLPIDARAALEEEQDKASAAEAEKLLALDPRARVLALMERAACRNAEEQECPLLRPADLRRVLESFPGVVPPDDAVLIGRFADMLKPPA
jgi:hypothetical protein